MSSTAKIIAQDFLHYFTLDSYIPSTDLSWQLIWMAKKYKTNARGFLKEFLVRSDFEEQNGYPPLLVWELAYKVFRRYAFGLESVAEGEDFWEKLAHLLMVLTETYKFGLANNCHIKNYATWFDELVDNTLLGYIEHLPEGWDNMYLIRWKD
jgi:hypothetical protein